MAKKDSTILMNSYGGYMVHNGSTIMSNQKGYMVQKGSTIMSS